ncbi:hypothetical protein [Phenylobacterium sp.]|uniref:hypothetical protein n=1 Tax=Phenylobacterium sp. TaxID=1871053 RepID=UPI0027374247|nr:hypothetical protein [Phenylobacterium sp.]MDP3658404.1 hypothetical protein [Phenylobacterium sp.]
MAFTRAWVNFKRMQDVAAAAAMLIYAGAVVRAFQVLPGGSELIVQRALIWPAMFMALSLLVPLATPPLRRLLGRYVWMSYQAGFGQTPASVLGGIGLLCGAALFIYWQVAAVAHGGRYPAGVFSGYGAGIGIMLAQALLVRVLERLPEVRRLIEEPS